MVHAELVLEGRGALDRGGGEAREVWDRRGAAECDGLGCHLEKITENKEVARSCTVADTEQSRTWRKVTKQEGGKDEQGKQ